MPPSGGARKGAGRKAEIKADKNLNIRIDEATLKKLAQLEKRWKCTKSEAVRKAIHDACKPSTSNATPRSKKL